MTKREGAGLANALSRVWRGVDASDARRSAINPSVMAGLAPAIHVFLLFRREARRGCPAQGRA